MIKLLITDLDDTLYSWIGFFVPAFYDMAQELSNITNIPFETLIKEYRTIHQISGSVEYPYATVMLPSIKERYPYYTFEQLRKELDSAFHKFNSTRKKYLALFSGVRETLDFINQHGITLVGYTESAEENGFYRLKKLGIDQLFKTVYVSNSKYERPDHLPSSPKTQIVHAKKPNPNLLLEICEKEQVKNTEAVYIGDSLTKDILMAKQASIISIWCNYKIDTKEKYKKLVDISHWTEEDFCRERQLKELWINSGYSSDYTIHSFDEVKDIVSCINGYC